MQHTGFWNANAKQVVRQTSFKPPQSEVSLQKRVTNSLKYKDKCGEHKVTHVDLSELPEKCWVTQFSTIQTTKQRKDKFVVKLIL